MPTKDQCAEELVEWHYQVDSGMTRAIRLFAPNEDDPREPIKFLEVSPDTPASGNVMTFTFGPTDDIPYSMRIATITPEEMEQVERGEIPLPEGWDLDHSFVYPAPTRRSQEGKRWRRSREIARSFAVLSSRPKPLSAYQTRRENR